MKCKSRSANFILSGLFVRVVLITGWLAAGATTTLGQGTKPAAEDSQSRWPELIRGAERKTPMEIVKASRLRGIAVVLDPTVDSKISNAAAIKKLVESRLADRGLKIDDDGEVVAMVFVKQRGLEITVGGDNAGTVHGVFVDVRLARRGYYMEHTNFFPVIGTLLRGTALEISTEPSREDFDRFVLQAVDNLFLPGAQAEYVNPPEWKPLANTSVDRARLSFIDANLAHLEAENPTLPKDEDKNDPYYGMPLWAPRSVNIKGNPLKDLKSVRLAQDITIPRFEAPGIALADLGIDNTYTKRKWVEMLREQDVGFGPGPYLQYDMFLTDELRVHQDKYWFLMGATRVTAADVLFESGDGFVRSPASIFHSFDLRFTTTGEVRPDLEAAIRHDVDRFAASLRSDWLWGKPAAKTTEETAIRLRSEGGTPRMRVIAPPGGEIADVPDSKFTGAVLKWLRKRQLFAVPESAAKRFAAQIAWEVESSSFIRDRDPVWWENDNGGPSIKLDMIEEMQRNGGVQRKNADDLERRIRSIDPLMYHSYDNLVGRSAWMGQRPVLPAGFADRLMRERPIGRGTLAQEIVVDARTAMNHLVYHTGSDELRQKFDSQLRVHQSKFEHAKMIRAQYVPSDGSSGMMIRYFWVQTRPKSFDDFVASVPAECEAFALISRTPVTQSPDRLSEVDQQPTEKLAPTK